MEEPAPYNTCLKKFFHNANESGPMKAKRMGDNIVPLGCFNDPGDRLEVFIDRINDSVFPFLQQLEVRILETFSNVRIFYSGSISNEYHKNLSLKDFQNISLDYLNRFGTDDYRFVLNYDCVIEIPNDVILFGTQVIVDIGDET